MDSRQDHTAVERVEFGDAAESWIDQVASALPSGALPSAEGRDRSGAGGFVVAQIVAVAIPLVAMMSVDDLFFEVGLGLFMGMILPLGYAYYTLRRSLRRASSREALAGDDPNDTVEECEDFVSDVVPALVLAFLIAWILPARPYLIEAGETLTAWALTMGSGVLGFSALVSLGEGILRAIAHRRAQERVEECDAARHLPPSNT